MYAYIYIYIALFIYRRIERDIYSVCVYVYIHICMIPIKRIATSPLKIEGELRPKPKNIPRMRSGRDSPVVDYLLFCVY